MSDLKEYEGYFEKFQDEFIRFKTGKKTYEKCPGCSEKKRFSINERKLTYSCGPKGGTKKCGPQWTIELPKYIDSDIREKELLDIIHGRLDDYTSEQGLPLQILQPLLDESHVIGDLKAQEADVKGATSELQALRDRNVTDHKLSEKNTMLQDLAKERLKNSQEKAFIMQKLLDDETSVIEKKELRTKYAQIVSDEKKNIIPKIKAFRIQRSPILMIDYPKIVKHT
jgi:hypothetical protein